MVEVQYCLFRSVLNFFRKTHDVNRRDLRLFNTIFSKANGQLRLENEDVLMKGRGFGGRRGGVEANYCIDVSFSYLLVWHELYCVLLEHGWERNQANPRKIDMCKITKAKLPKLRKSFSNFRFPRFIVYEGNS